MRLRARLGVRPSLDFRPESRTKNILGLVSLSVLLLPGCEILAVSDWEVRRAVIPLLDEGSGYVTISSPAVAGEVATITVTTSGNSCFSPAYTHFQLDDMVLTIEPYDSVRVGDILCLSVPCGCRHVVEVAFPRTGEATLRVIGFAGHRDSYLITRERTLTVE